MSSAEFQIPRKFTFDEFYDLLKKLVADPDAQKQFAIYDAECKAGRGDILYGENGVAQEALFKFRSVGILMLYELGWPNYGEALKHGSKTRSSYKSLLYSFTDTGLTIMAGGGAAYAPDVNVDINNPESVLQLLLAQMSNSYLASSSIFDLTGAS
jgi:ABC-type glycerol-3-phosphate transport system permease component